MSSIHRSLWFNPVEPAPLSLRAPAGVETWIDFSYFDHAGTIFNYDVGGQLQLTGRSDNHTLSYAVPATDAVNGRARAVIPKGDLTDPNGYRLRLVGTVNQQPALIAMGSVSLISTAGTTQLLPEDVIDSIDIVLAYNVDATLVVSVWHDTGKTNPFTLEAADISAVVLSSQGGPAIAAFTVTESGNDAVLTMGATTVNLLPPNAWWTLSVSSAAGVQTLAQGNVTVTGAPTP